MRHRPFERAVGLDARPLERALDTGIGGQRRAEAVGSPHDRQRDGADGHQQRRHRSQARAAAGQLAPGAARKREGHRPRGEDGHQRQAGQDRQEQDGRELGRECQAGGQPGQGEPAGAELSRSGVEGDDRQEHEERDAGVGRHELAVGEDVGAEHAEEQGEHGGGQAVAGAGPQEHRDGEQRAEDDDGQPPPEEEAVGVVPAVQEPLAELPLPAHRPRLVVGLDRHVHEEQGQGGQRLHQRRVLRVEPVVAELEVRVAGRQVRALVEGGRLPPHAADRQRHVDGHAGRDGRRRHGAAEADRHRAGGSVPAFDLATPRATTSASHPALASSTAPVPTTHSAPHCGRDRSAGDGLE